jgi:hypothetical protein
VPSHVASRLLAPLRAALRPTRRSARRGQTLDSLRRTLAAVAEFFRARAARLQAVGLKRAVVHLSAGLPARRRYAVAAALKRSSGRAVGPRAADTPAPRPQKHDVGHGQPVGQGGRRRAAARLAAAARERAHPADGAATRLGSTSSRRARAGDVAETAGGPDATQSGSAHGRRLN